MAQLSHNERLAAEKHERLREIEALYLRAKEYVKSEKFTEDRLAALAKIRKTMKLGDMEQGEALRIIGRIQQILIDAYEHESVIVEYEGHKATLAQMFPK